MLLRTANGQTIYSISYPYLLHDTEMSTAKAIVEGPIIERLLAFKLPNQ